MPEVPGVWMEHDVSLNFSDYKTASRYALHINAGYSDRLNGTPRYSFIVECPASTPEEMAWLHGWDMAGASIEKGQGGK